MNINEILNYLREFSYVSVAVRLALAVIIGGAIGIEREHKRRPAGFRTHILICLGAALTTITSQFLVTQGYFTDMGRLGAQVVAGIGFIGAGTIIVTKRRQVKGLTTAAGFWASAVIGLAVGAGYYEGAVIATALILVAEVLFSKLEYKIVSSSRVTTVLVEYTHASALSDITEAFRNQNVKVLDLEVTKSASVDGSGNPSAVFTMQLPLRMNHDQMMTSVSKIEGIVSVEEL